MQMTYEEASDYTRRALTRPRSELAWCSGCGECRPCAPIGLWRQLCYVCITQGDDE